ncbi:calmodulin-binding transcription activator 1 isoform X23 [Homo sapiens]|uniref:calmodulin-binding transcription activator 1 isoform X23 n=1 Tax=Homo sapiens TaxID=9606 RepID=UPI0007DC5952|nr:calmodulin-binding transcription activator 1 isoform X23 [Homo sapiens]XP_054191419.1 calmodulin-binding transcription activator 1 isoform X23 [Homo sapiens]|eukprot:XP_016856270.1 calmodulin-binding transcription activator 1 isoform X18 [Homo sapiens]
MWRAEGKWLPKTSRKSVSQSVFCGTSTYCVLNTVPPIEDDHGNSNSSHVKIFLPKKLLECLPKCSSLPKERHRWNTNEYHRVNYTRPALKGIIERLVFGRREMILHGSFKMRGKVKTKERRNKMRS